MLAKAFAARFQWTHLNSDLLRAELGLMGHYSPEDKQRVYEALMQKAREGLAAGKNILIDSTFYTRAIRQPFIQLASDLNTPLKWVEICASESTIRERVSRPRPDSEADWKVYESIRDAFEPVSDPHLTLHSDVQSGEEMLLLLDKYLHDHE